MLQCVIPYQKKWFPLRAAAEASADGSVGASRMPLLEPPAPQAKSKAVDRLRDEVDGKLGDLHQRRFVLLHVGLPPRAEFVEPEDGVVGPHRGLEHGGGALGDHVSAEQARREEKPG